MKSKLVTVILTLMTILLLLVTFFAFHKANELDKLSIANKELNDQVVEIKERAENLQKAAEKQAVLAVEASAKAEILASELAACKGE